MVRMTLSLRSQIGLEFYEFLKETDRADITNRIELKNIYNNEFRTRNEGTKDPNFGSILYALKVSYKITRRGDTIGFNSTVRAQYQDQWLSSMDLEDRQPEWNQNGAASPGPVQPITSAEEAVSGVRVRRKLASKLRLKTDWAQLVSDKHGVSINSDHQFEYGKLGLRVECTDEYVVNLIVENTGTKPVYFTYYTPLRWLKYFALKDEHKVTKINPLTLNPGDGYEIQVRFHCSLVGFYKATLAFEFQTDLPSSTEFHIVRSVEVQCMTSSFASLPHADCNGTNNCKKCMLFYNTFVAIAPNKCGALERRTLKQSASHLWHDSRKVRITASTAKRVPTNANPQNYIREHLYPSFLGNAATRHGTESEPLAYQWLERHGYVVSRRGTVVCANEPWLSASPDGVLNSEEEESLLEIKCPLLKSNECLDDRIRSQRYEVKMVEGTYQLQPNGSVYMQVQLGMFCTGLRACKLLIWTPSEQVLLQVPYNEQFCETTVARLKFFYFRHMLPRVSDKFHAGRLLLSAGYLQLCKE